MNLNKIDPIYILIKKLILRGFFKVALAPEESSFVADNISKHRFVVWINLLGGILIFLGLKQISNENIGTLVIALLGPVAVLGTAWFSISFGGIPAKLLSVAMEVTFWMFTAFLLSLTAMFISLAVLSPIHMLPVLLLIYFGVLMSAIQYDTSDGLKAGLDEALLKHSRAALIFYAKQGIYPEVKDLKK
jgi:hypothetical protein